MATRKFISRKTKKNARTQKGGSRGALIRPSRVSETVFHPRKPIRKPTLNQQKKRESHSSAVKSVVNAAEYFKQAAIRKFTNSKGTTRSSYDNEVVKNFLIKRGHKNNVASSVASLIRDRGIGYAASESGIEYTRPQLTANSKGQRLLGLSKTIRGYHNTLTNAEDKNRFINFINEQTKSRTNPLTSQNTASLVSKYKEAYGTYAELG